MFLAGALTISAQPVSATSIQCTVASYYGHGDGYHGRKTASGEKFNAYGLSTAHRSLPFGTRLVVYNYNDLRYVEVPVNDRGPFVSSRDLDLSYGAFIKIANPNDGLEKVCYAVVA